MPAPPVAFADDKILPLFQFFTRDHPPDGDDVHSLSVVAALGRGSAV